MDRCFNARHRSSNPVSARKTLTTAPPKFVQRLITARAKLVKQRWLSVQDFCVGIASANFRLAVPNFDWALLERMWTLPERKIARSSPLAIFCAAQNFRSGRRDHQRWPSVYSGALVVPNFCSTVVYMSSYVSQGSVAAAILGEEGGGTSRENERAWAWQYDKIRPKEQLDFPCICLKISRK